jgi:hypothetical protein
LDNGLVEIHQRSGKSFELFNGITMATVNEIADLSDVIRNCIQLFFVPVPQMEERHLLYFGRHLKTNIFYLCLGNNMAMSLMPSNSG